LNLREAITMKYGGLVVFIRIDCAETEIWGFRYGLTIVIGTLKIMARTGVFVRVVFALKHSTSSFPCSPSTIRTNLRHRNSYSHQKLGPERDFYEGRQRTKQT
jgi:hypothetical protein